MLKPYYENTHCKLYHGDCLDSLNLLDLQFDLLCTDPPYKITSKGNIGSMGGMLATQDCKKGKLFKEYKIDHDKWLKLCFDKLKDKTHAYIMSNQVNFRSLCDISERTGFKYHKALIWNKGNKIAGCYYMNSFEFIIFLHKGISKPINNCGCSDILSIPNKKLKDGSGVVIRPTEKPVELMKVLISNSTQENEIVLDPFCGIGSVGIACMELNRKCVLIEKDEHYCEVTAKRLEKL